MLPPSQHASGAESDAVHRGLVGGVGLTPVGIVDVISDSVHRHKKLKNDGQPHVAANKSTDVRAWHGILSAFPSSTINSSARREALSAVCFVYRCIIQHSRVFLFDCGVFLPQGGWAVGFRICPDPCPDTPLTWRKSYIANKRNDPIILCGTTLCEVHGRERACLPY